MIVQLRGILIQKRSQYIILDVHGVGYELQLSMTTIYSLPAINSEIMLYVYMIVRENAHILYGFADEQERTIFAQLIKISGIGPKLALTILSGMSVNEFIHCMEIRDLRRLVKIPGIGKKIAERLIIEIRDNLNISTTIDSVQTDAISALVTLGYTQQEAYRVVHSIKKNDADNTESLIKEALKKLITS